MHLRIIVILSVVLLGIGASVLAAEPDQPSPQRTYMLAIGVCPAWKQNFLTLCKASVETITTSFEKNYGIPKENIRTIIDEQGTYQGVQKGIEWLKSKDSPDNRVVFYINGHGGLSMVDGDTKPPRKQEVFVLWTEEQPFSIETAIEEKKWMTAYELDEMLDSLSSEKIIIIDVCHSGGSEEDLLLPHSMTSAINDREALILSSHAAQVAHFSKDSTMALFTHNLTEAIARTSTLAEAASLAEKQTKSDAVFICKTDKKYKSFSAKLCHQVPLTFDPNKFTNTLRRQDVIM